VIPLLAKTEIEHLGLSTLIPATLPESLGDIHTLRTLDVRGLGFSQVPSSINKLANLRRLDLRQTKIGAPDRKRVRAALPGCRIVVHDW